MLGRSRTNLWLATHCRDFSSLLALKGREPPDVETITLRLRGGPPGILIRRGSTDARVVWEVFHAQEFKCAVGWPFESVVDCGANSGVFLAYASSRPGATITRYVGVEPDAESFAFLVRQVENLGFRERSLLIHAAATAQDGTTRFDDRGESWGRRVSKDGGVLVETRSLQSILDDAGLPVADLVKLDVEGSEREIIGAAHAWRDRVRGLVCELHADLNQAWFDRSLRPLGYRTFRPGQLFRSHPSAVREDMIGPWNVDAA